MSTIKVGIIGGTGLNNPDLIKNRKEKNVKTPFGEPSGGFLVEGDIAGVPCVLLSRHGPGHSIPPSKVNFRANIQALKDLGCTHLIATTATGSLKEEIKPGDLVILNDFVDRTYKRRQSFYDGETDSLPGVFHLPMHPPFSEPLRKLLIETAKETGLQCHEAGTVVTIEGPRFSSKAESKIFQSYGCDLINMTTVPEVMLAKEAGLMYAAIAVATDYDCWKENHETVSHEAVLKVFKENIEKVQKFIIAVVEKMPTVNWEKDIAELNEIVKNSIM